MKGLFMHLSTVNYQEDFYAWTQEQAAILEARQFADLDLSNLVEEIACLGRSEKRTLGSHLKNLVLHLLKWQHQPAMRQTGQSWRLSILKARHEMDDVLHDSPSLRREVPGLVMRQYPEARRAAQEETGLPLAMFPEYCPWTPEQLLDVEFFPEA